MALQAPVGLTSCRPECPVTGRQTGPTYTTAGTIYNPNSLQPLQPPARRGRSLKWTSTLPPDLALLPKSMLSALPLHPHGSTRPAPAIKYSPLQQNYDRAISPGFEPVKPLVDEMTAFTPRTFAKNHPAEGLDDCKNESENSDDDDEETELRMKPLLSMPVKSLHNLASYPNPNQKIAQKVILRGVRSNLASSTTPGPDVCGRNSAGTQEDFATMEREPLISAGPSVQNPATIGSTATEAARRKDLQFVNHGQMRASLYRSTTEGSLQDEPSGYTTLASGPGAPRPLTAGPPGQRQYRPSTFDTTFKALRAKDMKFGTRDGASPPQVDNDIPSTAGLSENGDLPRSHVNNLLGDSTPFNPQDDFGNDGSSWVHAWQRGQNPSHYEDQTLRKMGIVESQALGPSAEHYRPLHPFRARACDDASTTAGERAANRLLNVRSAWESGQFAGLPSNRRADVRNSAIGVIGDKGAPRTGLENGCGERLSMEEANKLSAAEHAKPLLELVLASLDRNLSWSHFATPEPSLIDDSEEGNKSLFGKSVAEDKNAR